MSLTEVRIGCETTTNLYTTTPQVVCTCKPHESAALSFRNIHGTIQPDRQILSIPRAEHRAEDMIGASVTSMPVEFSKHSPKCLLISNSFDNRYRSRCRYVSLHLSVASVTSMSALLNTVILCSAFISISLVRSELLATRSKRRDNRSRNGGSMRIFSTQTSTRRITNRSTSFSNKKVSQ